MNSSNVVINDSYAENLVNKLNNICKNSNVEINLLSVQEAIIFAKECHKGQFRKSGEPFYSHPLAVAELVADYSLDEISIISAILHDTLEDSSITFSKIAFRFGEDVAEIVDSVTKISSRSNYKLKLKEEQILEKLYNINNNSAILVKLCDRLHNLQTIDSLSHSKKQKKALETIRTYVPLAKYLGIKDIEEKLSRLSFIILEEYKLRTINEMYL